MTQASNLHERSVCVPACVYVHMCMCVGKHDHTVLNVNPFLKRLLCMCSQLPKLNQASKPDMMLFLF